MMLVILAAAIAGAGICGAVAWIVSSALKYAATLETIEPKAGSTTPSELATKEAEEYERMADRQRKEFKINAPQWEMLAKANIKKANLFSLAASKLRAGVSIVEVEAWLGKNL